MSEEIKAPETAKNETVKENETVKKETKKRRPAMTLQQAKTKLRQHNARFDNDANDKIIIALAKAIPQEKFYKIIIQEKEDVTAKAYIGINGRAWYIERGEEVVVPARVVEALKNAVGFTPYLVKDKVTGERVIKSKIRQAELYTVLGEVPPPVLKRKR